MDDIAIKKILRTYGLSKKLEDRLVGIVSKGIKYHGLNSFDRQYEYIDYLVQKFTARMGPTISLDQACFDDSDKTLQDLLIVKQPSQCDFIVAQDLFRNLIGELSNEENQILSTLLKSANLDLIQRNFYDMGKI